jgi:hypothetical protein
MSTINSIEVLNIKSVYSIEISKEVFGKVLKLAYQDTAMVGPFDYDMFYYNHRFYTSRFNKGMKYLQISFDNNMTIDESL